MTARTLKIKIKLGNGDVAGENEGGGQNRPRDTARRVLHTVPANAAAESSAPARRSAASHSDPVRIKPPLALGIGAAFALTAALIYGLSGNETNSEKNIETATVSETAVVPAVSEPAQAPLPVRSTAEQSAPKPVIEQASTSELAAPNGTSEQSKPVLAAVAPIATTTETPALTAAPASDSPRPIAAAPIEPSPVVADEAPPAPAASQRTVAETAPIASRYVARAQLTSEIQNREPSDNLNGTISADPSNLKRVFFFTELRDLKGQRVTHRWEYDGQPVAEISLRIGSDRWRTYSSKFLDPSQIGQWQVSVLNEQGKTLHQTRFSYGDDGR